ISGTPQMIGEGSGVGGVSPMNNDCSMVENGIVWIFEQVLGSSAQTVCEVAAQEIGHAIGMDHEYLCQDPMTYLYGCGHKTFQDQTVSCGEYSARNCMCTNPLTGTAANQNSVQFMLYRLGPATGGTGGSGGNPGARAVGAEAAARVERAAGAARVARAEPAARAAAAVTRHRLWSRSSRRPTARRCKRTRRSRWSRKRPTTSVSRASCCTGITTTSTFPATTLSPA